MASEAVVAQELGPGGLQPAQGAQRGLDFLGAGAVVQRRAGVGIFGLGDVVAKLLALLGQLCPSSKFLGQLIGGPLQALMREVASGPNSPYYHYAPDGDALRAVFREVANHLSELRLSK
jgi:hypothetical protein